MGKKNLDSFLKKKKRLLHNSVMTGIDGNHVAKISLIIILLNYYFLF